MEKSIHEGEELIIYFDSVYVPAPVEFCVRIMSCNPQKVCCVAGAEGWIFVQFVVSCETMDEKVPKSFRLRLLPTRLYAVVRDLP